MNGSAGLWTAKPGVVVGVRGGRRLDRVIAGLDGTPVVVWRGGGERVKARFRLVCGPLASSNSASTNRARGDFRRCRSRWSSARNLAASPRASAAAANSPPGMAKVFSKRLFGPAFGCQLAGFLECLAVIHRIPGKRCRRRLAPANTNHAIRVKRHHARRRPPAAANSRPSSNALLGVGLVCDMPSS